jgi:hypothetical protein
MVIYSMLDAVLVSAILGRDPAAASLIIPHGSQPSMTCPARDLAKIAQYEVLG